MAIERYRKRKFVMILKKSAKLIIQLLKQLQDKWNFMENGMMENLV